MTNKDLNHLIVKREELLSERSSVNIHLEQLRDKMRLVANMTARNQIIKEINDLTEVIGTIDKELNELGKAIEDQTYSGGPFPLQIDVESATFDMNYAWREARWEVERLLVEMKREDIKEWDITSKGFKFIKRTTDDNVVLYFKYFFEVTVPWVK